jgi:putative redox protein
MEKLHGNAKLVKGFRIDVDDGRSHAICLDLQKDEGGSDMGPSGLELALMSYAGCYAIIFALTAQKMRIKIENLDVKAEGLKSEEEGTITEINFNITVKTNGREDRIQRIHELTAKDCPVGIIFDKAGIKSTYKVGIEKASA